MGLSVNAKNKLGRTPFHVKINNNGYTEQSSAYAHNERYKPLLELFQKSPDFDINVQDSAGLTFLHLAAMRGEGSVEQLLAAGADPTVLTNDNRNVLHLACRARDSNIVSLLIEKIPRQLVNQADSFGRTPLHDACASGRPESVCFLLLAGADINAKSMNGRTPLHSCVEFMAEKVLWSALLQDNDGTGRQIKDEYRPVTAPYNRRYHNQDLDTARVGGIVKSLLLAGADATIIAVDGHRDYSPLDLALLYGCLDMVKELQFTVGDMTVAPGNLLLQTRVALKNGTPSRITNLPENLQQEVLRSPAVFLRSFIPEDIKWLVENEADITGKNDVFRAASFLNLVAAEGLTELMQVVGSHARFYDDYGVLRLYPFNSDHLPNMKPLLHVACGRELPNLQMLEVLIETCGVNVNCAALVVLSDYTSYPTTKSIVKGGTALHFLATGDHWWQLDAIRYLVKHGANLECRNERMETLLHIACDSGKLWMSHCVQLLLELGADVDAVDKDGKSALYRAFDNPKITKLLLQHGAGLSTGGLSPLFSHLEDTETLVTLLDAGMNPNAKDEAKCLELDDDTIDDQERYVLFCASFPRNPNYSPDSSYAPMDLEFKWYGPQIKLLIERGADIYAPLSDHETLIHFVFEHAQYEMSCAFLEVAEYINLNARDQLGRTVLHAACKFNDVIPGYQHRHKREKAKASIVKLLKCDVDLLAVDNDGRNALHYLLDNCKMEADVIIEFLDSEISKILIHMPDKKGFYPIHRALNSLRPRIVEKLIEIGADILRPDPTGATALHYIASHISDRYKPWNSLYNYFEKQKDQQKYFTDCSNLFHEIINLGADINARDNKGSPAIFYFLTHQHSIRTQNNGENISNVDLYRRLWKDADVHLLNNEGESALHILARWEPCDGALFELLIGTGLDPLAEDGRGRSSLDVAAASYSKGILELFRRD